MEAKAEMKEQVDNKAANEKRPFLGIQFECCSVYARIYRKKNEMKYEGRCPKCLRRVSIQIDPRGGTTNRFFRAL